MEHDLVVDELRPQHPGDLPPDPVASTALWMAAERARESARPDHLFDDPLAARLATANSVLLADVSGRPPSGIPHMATWFARLEKAGMNRIFATDDPEGLFASHGWQAH